MHAAIIPLVINQLDQLHLVNITEAVENFPDDNILENILTWVALYIYLIQDYSHSLNFSTSQQYVIIP